VTHIRGERRKEFVVPLGKTEEPSFPFLVTSMDITCTYLVTPRKSKYLLSIYTTFPNGSKPTRCLTSPQTCARVYCSQILTLAQDPLY